MLAPDFMPTTPDEFTAQLQALKARVLERIAAHFVAFPAPVNRIDRSTGPRNYVPLLDYHVTTTEESRAFVTELRAKGFRYETPFERNGRENYATLGVEVLIDLVRVLDRAR